MKTTSFRFAFTLLALTAALGACGQQLPADQPISIWTPQAVAQLETTEEGPLLLDVRTSGEFDRGRIPGAVNIPHRQLERRIAEIEPFKEREVIVYCEKGVRARFAVGVLSRLGFHNVALIEGDMGEWRRSGLPIER